MVPNNMLMTRHSTFQRERSACSETATFTDERTAVRLCPA
jgi:hypothetical protein